MSVEEIIVYAAVALAAVFSIRVFFRQFNRDESGGKCSSCVQPDTETSEKKRPKHLR